MNSSRKGISLNGAPSQYERWLRTVEPDSVKVDSRTFTELLSFAVQFGRLVTFYDLEDRPDGDWTPFFLTDPTMILASIEALNLRNADQQFSALLDRVLKARHYEEKVRLLRECFLTIINMARQIDAWLGGAQINPHSRPARLFAAEAATWIGTKLSHKLRELKAHADGAALAGALDQLLGLNFERFAPVWKLAEVAPDASHYSGHTKEKRVDQAASRLEEIFRMFFEVFRHLQQFAARHLPETLLESHHKPQIALYIAFVRLYENAQHTMNTLTRRFTEFYYCDILRETKAGPVPDSVYLTLVLDPAAGVDETTVPAGTQFPAGEEEDGSAILYASSEEVSVSAAVFASLRAIRVVSGPAYTTVTTSPDTSDFSPDGGSPPAQQAIQQVLGTEIDVTLMNEEAAGKGPSTGPIPWVTFGEITAGSSDIATAAPVTLGFAIASPYLMLTGGQRTVTLTFELQAGASQLVTQDLEDIAFAAGLDPLTVFEQVTCGAFDLYLSTTDGWFQVDSYTCTASAAWLSLSFTLTPSALPVVAFNPAPDAPPPATPPVPDTLNPEPTLPTLKAYLRQTPVVIDSMNGDIAVYPLTLLAGIRFDRTDINTWVSDLANLEVENTSGPLDTSSPYPVFSGIPVTGSFIQFTNQELFVKKPVPGSLRVSLLWFGLPPEADGFKGYYRGYIVGLDGQESLTPLFDNQTFRSQMQVLNPGSWDLRSDLPYSSPPADPGMYLFRTLDDCANPVPAPDGTLCPGSDFDTLEVVDHVPPSYYDPSTSAIRLTLTEPPYAFGNALYAPNVLNAVVAEMPATETETATVPACTPLADAADALAALLPSGTGTPPSKTQIQAAVSQAEERLIQASQGYLSKSLAQYGESVGTWIQQTFTVSGSKAAPYRAQTIRARLQAALPEIENPGDYSPTAFLPKTARDPIRRSSAMLQAVTWLQQSLDHCAAEPDGAYQQCITTQLAACRQKLQQSYAACVKSEQPVNYPNTPWTPQAQSLTVSYSAQCNFSPTSASDSSGSYFYLLPYGGYERASDVTDGKTALLLPVPEPGILELGFSGLDDEQSLSFLIQMSSGSAVDPPAVAWQYLMSNAWVPFSDAQIPADTTNALQNSGILTLNVPSSQQGRQTVASSGYRWLRAVTQAPDDFPDTIGIYPHPLLATWVSGGGGSGQHLSQPLPPYVIKSSVQNLASIKTISQPIESFGGRPAENDKTFQVRLAERLRHKDRAILSWDYEQLMLEQFPTIWKVQALPATTTQGSDAAGHVLVVVVAGPDSIQVADPTEPLASADMLDQIQTYLAPLASPFAGIQVVNPVYVRVKVFAEVMFGGEDGGGGGIDQLNSELVQYLSPWFYDAERAAARGNYASRDSITQFIQTRPYVDALIEIRFQYEPRPETLEWYFLTSATSHAITEADEAGNSERHWGGNEHRCRAH